MTETEVLDCLKQYEALLEGHFELRSGLHSNAFFQMANVLRYPRVAGTLCEALVGRLRASGIADDDIDAVLAPALGGLAVGHEVARALDVPSLFVEKVEGALALRRFTIAPGDRLVIAEDVVTRGGRVQETIDIAEACGATVVAVLVLVDRSGGRAAFGAPLHSLLAREPVTYEPADCPLCRQGEPLVHPGS